MQSRAGAWRRWVVVAALVSGLLAGVVGQRPAGAAASAVSGSAFGYFTNVGLFGGPPSTRGPAPSVSLPSTGGNQTDPDPSGIAQYGPAIIFESGALTVSTQGTAAPTGSSASSAVVEDLGDIDPFHAPAPDGQVSSTCSAGETGVTGSTRIVNGSLVLSTDPTSGTPTQTVVFPHDHSPAPNTQYTGTLNHIGDNWRIVFNEQVVTSGSITVNAVHLYLLGPTAVGELIIAQSHCHVVLPTATAPTLISPTHGATGVTTPKTFSWTTVGGADNYYLTIGTTPGAYDVLNSGVLPNTQTSYNVANLPSGTTLYARIYARVSGDWNHFTDSPFSTAATAPTLTNPPNGATGVIAPEAFTWTTVAAAESYYLTIGTTPGGYEVLNSGVLPNNQTSYDVASLPRGTTLHARIYTKMAGTWHWSDSTFSTAATAPTLTNPPNGATGVTAPQTFSWTTVSGAANYYLTIGTTPGAYDVLNSGVLPNSQASYDVASLPPGTTLHSRIYANVGGNWYHFTDSTFSTAATAPILTNPPNGATGVTAPQTFTWTTVAGVENYYLTIGTTPGAYDVLNSGALPNSQASYAVASLPPGTTLYARVYANVGGSWNHFTDSTFTSA